MRVESLILVHVDHEPLTSIGERPQEIWLLAVPGVGTDPGEAGTASSRLSNDLQGHRTLADERLVFDGDMRLGASFRVIRPALRQIQSTLNQRRCRTAAESAEYSDLAIVDLAQSSIPLTRDTG